MRINLGDIARSPEFSSNYIIKRQTVNYVNGDPVFAEELINLYGTVTTASTKDVDLTEFSDRGLGMLKFYAKNFIFLTTSETNEVADEILFQNETYKVVKTGEYQMFGYNYAIGLRQQK